MKRTPNSQKNNSQLLGNGSYGRPIIVILALVVLTIFASMVSPGFVFGNSSISELPGHEEEQISSSLSEIDPLNDPLNLESNVLNKSKNSVSINGQDVSVEANSDSRSEVKQTDSNISIKIESKSESTNTPPPVDPPILSVNGQEIELPENGRVRETFETENSRTRFRANVDGEGSSSIDISTKTIN